MRYTHQVRLLVAALLLASLLAACGQPTIEIDVKESSSPGHWQVSYLTFSGTKNQTVQGQAGQDLLLQYQVTLDKGVLEFRVENVAHEVLWDTSIQENASGTVTLRMYQDGPYTIIAHGTNTGGSFDLTWQVQ